MTAKEFINKKHPKMVDNWSHQASLLTYRQVAHLMEDFHLLQRHFVLEAGINKICKADGFSICPCVYCIGSG